MTSDDPDAAVASAVVLQFVAEMHRWEVFAAQNPFHFNETATEADFAAHWARIQAPVVEIFERLCTPKERKYGAPGLSFRSPPGDEPGE